MPYELSLGIIFHRLEGKKNSSFNINHMSFLACTWRLGYVS